MMEKRTDLEGLDRYIELGYSANALAERFDFDVKFIMARKHGPVGMVAPFERGCLVRVKPHYLKTFPKRCSLGRIVSSNQLHARVLWKGLKAPQTFSIALLERVA